MSTTVCTCALGNPVALFRVSRVSHTPFFPSSESLVKINTTYLGNLLPYAEGMMISILLGSIKAPFVIWHVYCSLIDRILVVSMPIMSFDKNNNIFYS